MINVCTVASQLYVHCHSYLGRFYVSFFVRKTSFNNKIFQRHSRPSLQEVDKSKVLMRMLGGSSDMTKRWNMRPLLHGQACYRKRYTDLLVFFFFVFLQSFRTTIFYLEKSCKIRTNRTSRPFCMCMCVYTHTHIYYLEFIDFVCQVGLTRSTSPNRMTYS